MTGQTRKLLRQAISAISFILFIGTALLTTCEVGAAQTASTNKPAASTSSVRTQLIGSWRLVSRESRKANGEIEPDPSVGAPPLGILIYDQSGHVSAQTSRGDRTVAMLPEECQAAIATKGAANSTQAILGYNAYFGTYTINEHDATITHHLEAALFPGDIGKDIERHYAISGDLLRYTFNTTDGKGGKVTRTVVWQRMK
jgi:hypothetical protein